jgi:hypothetical protein
VSGHSSFWFKIPSSSKSLLVTEIVTVFVELSTVPSFILYVKVSSPKYQEL